jgi:hypothetical protein
MQSELVLIPAPSIGEQLSLSCGADHLGVEQLNPELAAEPLGNLIHI